MRTHQQRIGNLLCGKGTLTRAQQLHISGGVGITQGPLTVIVDPDPPDTDADPDKATG